MRALIVHMLTVVHLNPYSDSCRIETLGMGCLAGYVADAHGQVHGLLRGREAATSNRRPLTDGDRPVQRPNTVAF
ncbi:hypothetical protein JCM17823_19110 [Halorubrum gandharaense]